MFQKASEPIFVAAEGEQEQARQTEYGLAVGAHLAFGVLEGLVLIGAARLEHAAVQGGGLAVRKTMPLSCFHALQGLLQAYLDSV